MTSCFAVAGSAQLTITESTMNSNLNSMLSGTNPPQTDVREMRRIQELSQCGLVISTEGVTLLIGVQVSSVRIWIFSISSCNE